MDKYLQDQVDLFNFWFERDFAKALETAEDLYEAGYEETAGKLIEKLKVESNQELEINNEKYDYC